MVRSAVGDNEGGGEFLERMYDLHDQVKEHDGCQHRKCNIPELDPFVRPVHRSRLIKLCRNVLKPCEKQHHG